MYHTDLLHSFLPLSALRTHCSIQDQLHSDLLVFVGIHTIAVEIPNCVHQVQLISLYFVLNDQLCFLRQVSRINWSLL